MRKIRNLIRYMVVLILNIFIMLIFHSYVNFLLLVVLILFPFYSIFSLYRIKQNISMEIMLPDGPMEKGSEFYLRLGIYNPTWFPLINATIKLQIENGFYKERGTHYLNLPVRAKSKTEVTYPVVMEHCGRFKAYGEDIRLLDLLGIYEVHVPMKEEKECIVFPDGQERNQEAGNIYRNGVAEAMESWEKGYDFSEVSGIREYIPGDKLQNIHWKLSVKKEELMVKERISVSAMQLTVLVELANDEQMRLEAILELADSITKAFVQQNLPFTIYYYSTNLDELKGCYIGNEIERKQWLEMLLYDQSYMECGRVEELFFKQNPSVSSYLYIGYAQGLETEGGMQGDNQTAAVLRCGER